MASIREIKCGDLNLIRIDSSQNLLSQFWGPIKMEFIYGSGISKSI